PYTGGSHLPDLTVIGAIELEGRVGGYSAVRAHHSDVGGAQAGSMPAGAREIFAEGIILPPVRWTPEVERLLLANVRTPEARRGRSRCGSTSATACFMLTSRARLRPRAAT